MKIPSRRDSCTGSCSYYHVGCLLARALDPKRSLTLDSERCQGPWSHRSFADVPEPWAPPCRCCVSLDFGRGLPDRVSRRLGCGALQAQGPPQPDAVVGARQHYHLRRAHELNYKRVTVVLLAAFAPRSPSKELPNQFECARCDLIDLIAGPMRPSLPRCRRGSLIASHGVDRSDAPRRRNQRKRTPCFVGQLVGNTPEEEILHRAVLPIAHYDEICVLGVGDVQYPCCWMPFGNDDPMLGQGPKQLLLDMRSHLVAQVVELPQANVSHCRTARGGDRLQHMHRDDLGAAGCCLLDCPFECGVRCRRPIHSHNDLLRAHNFRLRHL